MGRTAHLGHGTQRHQTVLQGPTLTTFIGYGPPVVVFRRPAHSQSLGDLARQERERKMNQPHVATHVYDNDDLAKPQILTPEDQARVQPKEKPKPAASQPAAESVGNEP